MGVIMGGDQNWITIGDGERGGKEAGIFVGGTHAEQMSDVLGDAVGPKTIEITGESKMLYL